MDTVWLGFSRYAGEWELAMAWPGNDAGLDAAIGWLSEEPEPGVTRKIEKWTLGGASGPVTGSLDTPAAGSGEGRRGPRYDSPVMASGKWPTQMVAPCGCVTRTVGRTLTLTPCPDGQLGICPNASYVRMAGLARRRAVVTVRAEDN